MSNIKDFLDIDVIDTNGELNLNYHYGIHSQDGRAPSIPDRFAKILYTYPNIAQLPIFRILNTSTERSMKHQTSTSQNSTNPLLAAGFCERWAKACAMGLRRLRPAAFDSGKKLAANGAGICGVFWLLTLTNCRRAEKINFETSF